MHRLDIPREREPAATDVQDIGCRAECGAQRGRRVGEPAHVAELEVGRVAQVDRGMREAVEDEDANVGVGDVGLDGDAVIGALGVARRRQGQRQSAGQQHRDDSQGRRSPTLAPQPEAQGDADHDQPDTDRDDQHAGRE